MDEIVLPGRDEDLRLAHVVPFLSERGELEVEAAVQRLRIEIEARENQALREEIEKLRAQQEG
jgi:hypothetical protein